MVMAERARVEGLDGTASAVEIVGAPSTAEFLVVVGERVRRQRALVHLSRRRLAERSGVSERYLAQLETGRGNMSIALLRNVARALETPLAELVAEDGAVGIDSGPARSARVVSSS